MTKQDIYSKLSHTASAIIGDRCGIQTSPDGRVSCLDSRAKGYVIGCCCNGCPHLSNSGCTVESLACRLWTCFTFQKNHPDTTKALMYVSAAARNAGIPHAYRMSKEENFRGEE